MVYQVADSRDGFGKEKEGKRERERAVNVVKVRCRDKERCEKQFMECCACNSVLLIKDREPKNCMTENDCMNEMYELGSLSQSGATTTAFSQSAQLLCSFQLQLIECSSLVAKLLSVTLVRYV